MRSAIILTASLLLSWTLSVSHSSGFPVRKYLHTAASTPHPVGLIAAQPGPQDGPVQYRSGTVDRVTDVSLVVQF
jgi:hypothetical protein